MRHPRTPTRLALALALTGVMAGLGPAGAQAATASATSSNWAGYAVTRTSGRFRKVIGTWTVPAVTCPAGHATYSASWVGLGGSDTSSQALEQTGTESNCTAGGTARYTAWYEAVPDVSHPVRLGVRPRDAMTASVTVAGTIVRLRLIDRTRGTSVTKVLRADVVDTSSAEWIVEAPSVCTSSASELGCSTTELADFGTTGFTTARATTTGGHTGTISDPAFEATAITLGASGDRRFAGSAVAASLGGTATPGALAASGGGFELTYATATTDAGGGVPAPGPYAGGSAPQFPAFRRP